MAINILLSFAYHAKANLHQVKSGLRGQGLLMIDSGAFTAYTTGKTISLADYAAFLRDWAGAWDTAVTLDVIGDHAATARNTGKLHEMGLPVLPVFTFGTKMAELDAMAKEHPYICVGGTVGYTRQRDKLPAYLAAVRRRAASHGCAIHTLGVGSMAVIAAVKPYTADSSAASGAPVHGSVLIWDGKSLRSVSRADATRNAAILRRYGIHPGAVAAGQAWKKDSRVATGAIGFLAVALADENLKRRYQSPAPTAVRTDGPHLYIATPRDRATEWATIEKVATQIADGTAPPAWNHYRPPGPHLYSACGPTWTIRSALAATEQATGDRPPAAWPHYR